MAEVSKINNISHHTQASTVFDYTKELLDSFFSNSTDALCVLDFNGHVLNVNHRYEQMFGWSKEEILGASLPIVPHFCDQERVKLEQELLCSVTLIQLETCLTCKDGSQIDVSVTKNPIKNIQGDFIAFTVVFNDLSNRRKTEEMLRNSENLCVAGQLAAGLAHEIRNPLTSLRGFLQLLQSELAERNRHYFDIMMSELDQINFIVSEFLAVTRPVTIDCMPNDLKLILQSVFDLLKTHGLLYGAHLQLNYKSELVPIVCSKIHLKQLFINLVKNSIEAIEKEGVVKIEVSMLDDEHVLVSIIDNGMGIPDTCIEQLGEPFFTTKEKGTGLGLMMCYKIVKFHQGNMHISSKHGEGTKIDVVLPVQLSTFQVATDV
jgi:two-component system sporulation sensor kinase A